MIIQVEFFFLRSKAFIDGLTSFKWDTQVIGIGIQVTEDNTRVFLKEGPYMFRTAIGDQVSTKKKLT